MKQLSIKYTKDYLLLIEKVYGFKVGDWNYEEDNTIPVYQFDYNIDEYPGNKIIAYYPLTKEAKELDLPLLPNPFEDNFDLKQEIIRWYHSKSGTTLINDPSLNQIIDKAQSKQFSLEDVKKAIEMARETREEFDLEGNSEGWIGYDEEEIIQSLSTQQLPVSFEPEYEEVVSANWGYGAPCDYKLKTLINSEGREELVGTYKY